MFEKRMQETSNGNHSFRGYSAWIIICVLIIIAVWYPSNSNDGFSLAELVNFQDKSVSSISRHKNIKLYNSSNYVSGNINSQIIIINNNNYNNINYENLNQKQTGAQDQYDQTQESKDHTPSQMKNNQPPSHATQHFDSVRSNSKDTQNNVIENNKKKNDNDDNSNFNIDSNRNGLIELQAKSKISLIIAGGAKTGTTSLAFNLGEFDDLVYHGSETPYWSQCRLHSFNWAQFLEQFKQSDVSFMLPQSIIVSQSNQVQSSSMTVGADAGDVNINISNDGNTHKQQQQQQEKHYSYIFSNSIDDKNENKNKNTNKNKNENINKNLKYDSENFAKLSDLGVRLVAEPKHRSRNLLGSYKPHVSNNYRKYNRKNQKGSGKASNKHRLNYNRHNSQNYNAISFRPKCSIGNFEEIERRWIKKLPYIKRCYYNFDDTNGRDSVVNNYNNREKYNNYRINHLHQQSLKKIENYNFSNHHGQNNHYSSKESIRHCWFIEKAPQYEQAPFTGIIFANYLQHVKVILIARNPVKQSWSFLFHFSSTFDVESYKLSSNNIDEQQRLSRDIWYEYFDKNTKFQAVREGCKAFVNDLKMLDMDYINSLHGIRNIIHVYKQFISLYLKNYAQMAHTGDQRRYNGLIAAPMIFPVFLTYVYSFDEKYGFRNWNRLRIIQSEWLYYDEPFALGVIKCWLQTDKQIIIDFENNYDVQTIFDQCGEIYYNDKKYMNKIDKILRKDQDHPVNSNSKSKQHGYLLSDNNPYFVKMKDFFTPCNEALRLLLSQRNELLLGQWFEWGY